MTESRRRAILRLLAAAYVLTACGWALFSFFSAEIVEALYDGRVEPLGSLLIRKQTATGVDRSLVYYQARIRGLVNAAFVATTLFAAIAAGLLANARWIRIAMSNLAVAVFVLVAAEVGLRVLGYEFPAIARPGLKDRGVWSYDRTKGWFHRPLATGQSFLGGPDSGAIEINSLGLRDREIARVKPGGTKRILVFGDSYAFGVGVDASHVFSARLEALLATSTSQPVEVINLGVSGYSTDQEYILFRERGWDLDPDLVVLIVCHNDYEANTRDFIYFKYYKPYFTLAAAGEPELANVEVPRLTRWQDVKVWLGQESRLWNLTRSRRSDTRSVQRLLDFFAVAVPQPSTDDRLALTAGIIRRFADEVRERGVPMLVTTTAGGVDDDAAARRRNDQRLAALLKQADVDYLDLWPALTRARAQDPGKDWDFPDNLHWNVDAHRVAAETVREHLLSRGLIASGAMLAPESVAPPLPVGRPGGGEP